MKRRDKLPEIRSIPDTKQVWTEDDAQRLLSRYGIREVQEALVTTEHQAMAQATAWGFPVVLKGWGPALSHKTERGLAVQSHTGALAGQSRLWEAYFRQSGAIRAHSII